MPGKNERQPTRPNPSYQPQPSFLPAAKADLRCSRTPTTGTQSQNPKRDVCRLKDLDANRAETRFHGQSEVANSAELPVRPPDLHPGAGEAAAPRNRTIRREAFTRSLGKSRTTKGHPRKSSWFLSCTEPALRQVARFLLWSSVSLRYTGGDHDETKSHPSPSPALERRESDNGADIETIRYGHAARKASP